VTVAARRVDPVRVPPEPFVVLVDPLAAVGGREPVDPVDPVRGLAVDVFAPAVEVLALPEVVFAPPEPGRRPAAAVLAAAEPGRCALVVRTPVPEVAGAVAPAAPAGSTVQFLNMKNCCPSVHRFVVTQ